MQIDPNNIKTLNELNNGAEVSEISETDKFHKRDDSGATEHSKDHFITWGSMITKIKTYFKDVALTGKYNDLIERPEFKTVATSGSYNDLTQKPNFGSAAFKNSNDFLNIFVGMMIYGQMQQNDFNGWLKWQDGRQLSKNTYSLLWHWVSINGLIGKFFEDTNSNIFTMYGLSGRAVLTSGQGANLTNRNFGEKIGEENVILTTAQIPSHTHTVPQGHPTGQGGGIYTSGDDMTNTLASIVQTGSSGGGQSHNNVQPSVVLNTFIYSGIIS